MKNLLLAVGTCLLLAADLPAQRGLGGPPGQLGGGRGASAGRVAGGGGRPATAQPRGEMNLPGPSAGNPAGSSSRPTGNILYPGTPNSSTHGNILSPGGIVGQPSILSPGLPGPYRPGNVLTPGTPPATPPPGRISASPNHDDGYSRPHRGRGGFHRRGGGVIVEPYVYLGFPYGYGGYYSDGGYVVDSGAVSRGSSDASYVIEGHLDESSQREVRSRVYEVGPGFEEDTDMVETTPAGEEQSSVEPGEPSGEGEVVLIALKGGLIYAVREHWMLGHTVHFVTLQGDHYVVSLQEVDLDLSVRLNRERGYKFVLEVREQGARQPLDQQP